MALIIPPSYNFNTAVNNVNVLIRPEKGLKITSPANITINSGKNDPNSFIQFELTDGDVYIGLDDFIIGGNKIKTAMQFIDTLCKSFITGSDGYLLMNNYCMKINENIILCDNIVPSNDWKLLEQVYKKYQKLVVFS